jgi:putative acetyltransferase
MTDERAASANHFDDRGVRPGELRNRMRAICATLASNRAMCQVGVDLHRADSFDEVAGLSMDLLIERATSPSDDVRSLIAELEDNLAAEYPPEQRHGLALDAIFQPHMHFFVVRLDGVAVGCAGVALFDDFAEVKRMYVRPAARGRGIADALLARIETVTRDAGLARLCLETGDRQLAAMRVYSRAGFSRCAAFGDYATKPPASIVTSVFFEKYLAIDTSSRRE